MAIQELKSATFDEAIRKDKLVLVDFWAVWCGPCRMVSPVIDALADEYAGRVTVGKLNVDEEQEIAIRYGVMSIPTVILFKDGEEAERLVGVRPPETYRALLDGSL